MEVNADGIWRNRPGKTWKKLKWPYLTLPCRDQEMWKVWFWPLITSLLLKSSPRNNSRASAMRTAWSGGTSLAEEIRTRKHLSRFTRPEAMERSNFFRCAFLQCGIPYLLARNHGNPPFIGELQYLDFMASPHKASVDCFLWRISEYFYRLLKLKHCDMDCSSYIRSIYIYIVPYLRSSNG